MLDQSGCNQRLGCRQFAFLVDLIAPDVVGIPSHRRRERNRISYDQPKRPLGIALGIRCAKSHLVCSRLCRRTRNIPCRGIQRDALREALRRVSHRSHASHWHMIDHGTSRPHAENGRAIDPRRIRRWRRKDGSTIVWRSRRSTLRHQRGFADGAITGLGTRSRAFLNRLRRSPIPVVNVVRDVYLALPSVVSDNRAIGRVGAEYLAQRGFRHFAFVGIELPWSLQRRDGFEQALASAGIAPACNMQLRLYDFEYASKVRATRVLTRWVKKLQDKTAVMCASDFIGRAMLAACETAKVPVPDKIAVLGVDNFALECQLSTVPMSSVAQDFARQGFEAAVLLDRLMHQPRIRPKLSILVPPGRVFVRTSTDVFAFEDPLIVNALRIIQSRAATELTMKELLSEVPLSRKWLDHRFKAAVGRTPSDEIRRAAWKACAIC